jgi:hypothetical protein
MRNIFGMRGLGYTPPSATVNSNGIVTTITPPATPAPKVSLLDRILGTATKITDFGNKAAGTYTNITNALTPQQQAQAQAAAQAAGYTYDPKNPTKILTDEDRGLVTNELATSTKVGIGLGIAALVGGIIYAVTRKKKKGMGCPEPDADNKPDLSGVKKKKSKKRKK